MPGSFDKKNLSDGKAEEKKETEPIIKEDGSAEIVIDAPEDESIQVGEEEEIQGDKKEDVQTPKEEKTKTDADKKVTTSPQQNAAFAAMRVESKRIADENARLRADVEDLKASKKSPEKTTTQLDKELAETPAATVQEMMDARFAEDARKRKIERDKEDQERLANNRFDDTRHRSFEGVYSEHPELKDPKSIKSQIMNDILNTSADIQNNPNGPEIAAGRMEKEMKRRGIDVDAKADAETKRVKRVVETTRPEARNIGGSRTVTLSRDDMAFCKEHNLNPKIFAANKVKFGKGGTKGVEL